MCILHWHTEVRVRADCVCVCVCLEHWTRGLFVTLPLQSSLFNVWFLLGFFSADVCIYLSLALNPLLVCQFNGSLSFRFSPLLYSLLSSSCLLIIHETTATTLTHTGRRKKSREYACCTITSNSNQDITKMLHHFLLMEHSHCRYFFRSPFFHDSIHVFLLLWDRLLNFYLFVCVQTVFDRGVHIISSQFNHI